MSRPVHGTADVGQTGPEGNHVEVTGGSILAYRETQETVLMFAYRQNGYGKLPGSRRSDQARLSRNTWFS